MPTRDIDLPTLYRDASFAAPTSADDQQKAISVVWSTGAAVKRRGWDGDFIEELDLSAGAVDLGRLNAGAPVLDSHESYSIAGVIGRVERAWLEPGQARADVVFSERPEIRPIVDDIRGGIIRNVSVGYRVHQLEDTGERRGGLPVYLATRWEPLEISFVAVGADPGARLRHIPPTHPCHLTEKDCTMGEQLETAGGTPVTERTEIPPALDAAAIRADERARVIEINRLCRSAGCADVVAGSLIESGATLEAARAAILDDLIGRKGPAASPKPAHVDAVAAVVSDDDRRSALTDAIAYRARLATGDRGAAAPDGLARDYLGMTCLGAFAQLAAERGASLPKFPTAMALYRELFEKRSLTTSDFPSLLLDVMNKVLAPTYDRANPTYRQIARRVGFADLRDHYFVTVGDFPTLQPKNEAGEFEYGAVSDKHEKTKLTTYGRIVKMSRDIIINDDLGGLGSLASMAANRVADYENALFYTMLTSAAGAGPTLLETSRAVFNTTDKTLSSSSDAISVTSLGAGLAAVMAHTTQDGIKLNIMPRFLVASPAKYTIAKQYTSQNYLAQQGSNINPFAGELMPISDANLTGNAWYLLPDTSITPFVYGYLNDAPGPQFATREGFTTDGFEFRVTLDFAVATLDYRGVWRNPGA